MNNEHQQQAKESLKRLCETERLLTCGEEATRRYQNIHHNRFYLTLEICKKLVPHPHARVLDIGPSFFTTLLAQEYKDVSTLGLDVKTDHGGQRNSSALALALPHIKFDLNNSQNIEHCPRVTSGFDLIIFAETLEHLYIAPEYHLAFLGSLLTEKGLLLVTTPNAAIIMKRLILLLKGKNPYERIRLIAENPGHFREYTTKELIDIGTRCQFDPVYIEQNNFYAPANFIQGFMKRSKSTFKDSLIVAFRRM
jgi:2-polyprenyl-3-methyl-5-hydroxy-6-metoxy-1,4-benzoquinol methylase